MTDTIPMHNIPEPYKDMTDYDLITFPYMPALSDLLKYLNTEGKTLVFEKLSRKELSQMDKWWSKASKRLQRSCECDYSDPRNDI